MNSKPSLIASLVTLVAACCLGQSQARAASVTLQEATATFSQTDFGPFTVDRAINGTVADDVGWAIYPNIGNQAAVFETASDIGFSGGSLLTFTLTQTHKNAGHTLGRFRLSVTTDDRSSFADGLISGGDVTAGWHVLDPVGFLSLNGTTLNSLGDNSILASGLNPGADKYIITALTDLTEITGVRLDVLTHESLPFGGPGRFDDNGNFVLSELELHIFALASVPEGGSSLAFTSIGLASLAILRRKVRAI
jgi:hypothetical protein